MSELPDPRPVFTIVMGCDGVGKTTWKRWNYDLLPSRYFDQDSFAGGIGDWNSPEAHSRTRVYVEAQIAESIGQRLDFGIESVYFGEPDPALVDRVIKAGYRVEGVYFGTNDPQINIDRIEHRVLLSTGHRVDPARIPEGWKRCLSNLHRSVERFDLLRLLDNSEHDEFHVPRPVEQCRLERGRVAWQVDVPAPWCMNWLQGLTHIQAELHRHEATLTRRRAQAQSPEPLRADYGTGETAGRLREDQEDPEPDPSDYDFGR